MTFSHFFDDNFFQQKSMHVSALFMVCFSLYLNLFNNMLTAYAHSRMILNVDGSR